MGRNAFTPGLLPGVGGIAYQLLRSSRARFVFDPDPWFGMAGHYVVAQLASPLRASRILNSFGCVNTSSSLTANGDK
jgi:hypothetical protein